MSAHPRILILFAHPAFHKSRVHRALVSAVHGLEGVTFHDLYERYYDFQLDVEHEQRLLREHDLIVFQHPLYWYSSPAILKEWQDLVLEHGFAYGPGGTALQGKRLLHVLSTGATAEAYTPEGFNRHTLAHLLSPFEQTARFCGLEYLPPFVVHDSFVVTEADLDGHAERYRQHLLAYREGAEVTDR